MWEAWTVQAETSEHFQLETDKMAYLQIREKLSLDVGTGLALRFRFVFDAL